MMLDEELSEQVTQMAELTQEMCMPSPHVDIYSCVHITTFALLGV